MKKIIILPFLCIGSGLFAQNVGIGENAPTSKLEVKVATTTEYPFRLKGSSNENIFEFRPSTFYNYAAYLGGESSGSVGILNISNRHVGIQANPLLKLSAYNNSGGSSQAVLQFANENDINNDFSFRAYTGTTLANHSFSLNYRNLALGTQTLMYFDANRRMGVGTGFLNGKVSFGHNSTVTSPTLDLVESEDDYARLNFTNESTGSFWSIAGRPSPTLANQRLNFYNNSTGDLMTITGSGNVGIGETSPLYKLTVSGSINSTALAGTGVRNLKVDANGTLTTSAATNYQSISVYSFVKSLPSSASVMTYNAAGDNGVNFPAGATDGLSASVSLPHGSNLVNMRIIYRDNSAQNLSVSFGYTRQLTFGSVIVDAFTTAGASAVNQTSTLPVGHVIDNSTNVYFVRITPDSGDTWDGSLLYIKGIVFEYTQ